MSLNGLCALTKTPLVIRNKRRCSFINVDRLTTTLSFQPRQRVSNIDPANVPSHFAFLEETINLLAICRPRGMFKHALIIFRQIQRAAAIVRHHEDIALDPFGHFGIAALRAEQIAMISDETPVRRNERMPVVLVRV